MNTGMFDNPITQRNLETLRGFGVEIVERTADGLPAAMSAEGGCRTRPVLFEAVRRA
jgi:phosphopantothenoylcysteine decarboxylase/phosphopantothenate--cysteine ligase